LRELLNKVKYLRTGTCFGSKRFELPVSEYIDNLRIGIVEVTEVHTMCRANTHAGRIFAFSYPVNAEGTFIHIAVRVRIPGFVRA